MGLSWTNTNQTNISKVVTNNIEEEVEEVAQAVEEVHVVEDDESSTDENFDITQYDNQHDQSEDDS